MAGRRMTPKGEMSSSGAGPAIANLPPAMKAMFESRPPILFKAPIVKRKMPSLSGVGQFADQFEKNEAPERIMMETPKQRQNRIRLATMKANDEAMDLMAQDFDPHSNPHATADAYKTLFVSRISFDTTERKLRREFEQYGPIKSIRLVNDLQNKPRGYAFIEYEKESDMRMAYKRADGRKLDGRRVLVDVERGRTVKGWRPRRLGGGLGGTRRSESEERRERERKEREKEERREKERLEYEKKKEERRKKEEEREKEREQRRREREERDRAAAAAAADGGGGGRDRDRDRDREKEKDGRSERSDRDKEKDGRSERSDRDKDRKRDDATATGNGAARTGPSAPTATATATAATATATGTETASGTGRTGAATATATATGRATAAAAATTGRTAAAAGGPTAPAAGAAAAAAAAAAARRRAAAA
eukprot:CAMPEP_0194574346 /NCGR_PEP_ID=MMETSP0292-20121207/10239_1 /TAXON_ID=39354 /ORGANISM="Heterosigma akashiwo, Strain CCMP2393" /LENGTH=422 /DNA_ID=CAMNT_0039425859 /DNA_START=88 /DNA_END=1353 /DNA_ORIENTATION=+